VLSLLVLLFAVGFTRVASLIYGERSNTFGWLFSTFGEASTRSNIFYLSAVVFLSHLW
jgi:hypothetical protein